MKKKFYAASVTPFTNDDKADIESTIRILKRVYAAGGTGTFLFGTMGEWAQLTQEERAEILEAASSESDIGDLLVGISEDSLKRTLLNMDQSMKHRSGGFVAMLPNMRTSQVDPVVYFHTLCDHSDRPVYFYYAPFNNNIVLSPGQIAEIALHPNCGGIKNSAGQIMLRKELLALKREKNFMLFEGCEWAIDEAVTFGCDGVVCGIGALAPAAIRKILDLVRRGDLSGAAEIQNQLIGLFHGVYGKTSWIGQKYALKVLGVISSEQCRIQPKDMLSSERKREIEATVEKYHSLLEVK